MDNKGFTLVELIVVIGIVAILSGSTIGILQYRNYADINRSVKQISTMLDRTRTETISKKDKMYLYLYKTGESYYVQMTRDPYDAAVKGSKIANAKVELSYRVKGGAGDVPLDAAPITLTYKKSTGAFYAADGNVYTQITFKAREATRTIYLVEGTGRHYIK